MSIEPTNETKTAAAAVETASSSSGTGAVGGGGGAEEEEELTLVEISPSSSSSSPTTVSSLSPSSRTVTISSSTGAGDDDAIEVHPEAAAALAATRPVTTLSGTAVDSSSESSTIELVEEQPAKEQQEQHRPQPLLAPVAADVQDVAPGDRSPHESRTILPIQSSSSLSTPSSSEEYFDESLTTVSSSTEGALNVSSSNNQLNNNNNSTAIIELQSVVVTSEATAAAATPEQSADQGNTREKPADNSQPQQTKEAPIEIVQIFPSTKAADVSSSSTSTSGASSSSSSGASSESSSSSSPSVSPLAVDQQQQPQQQIQQPSSPPSTSALVQGDTAEVVSKMGVSDGDDQVPELLPVAVEEVSSPRYQPQQLPILPYRGSASSPQLKQSSLKKYKNNSKKMNNDGECEESSAPQRRVSFPQDAQLITGYLEPIDPWACGE